MNVAFSRKRRAFVFFCCLVIVVSAVLGAYQGNKYQGFLANLWKIPVTDVTIYKSDYWMGELIESIAERGEYRACYTDVRSAQPATVGLCFSAHRMPLHALFLVLVAKIFNNVVFLVVLKSVLSMALMCMAMWLIVSQAEDWRPLSLALLTVYLIDPANAVVFLGPVTEESLLLPQMALAGALLFSQRKTPAQMSMGRLVALAVLVAAMPMTKSSSLLPAVIIAVLIGVYARPAKLGPLLPAVALLVSLVAWGGFTYRTSGHFAFGSSMSSVNGYNLHHGYTRYYGEVAPRYNLDLPVSRGQIKLDAPVRDEWEFNKHFMDRTWAFIRENPGTSAWYLVIKAYAALIKLTPEFRPYEGEDGFFLPKHLVLTFGLLLDRLVLWAGLLASSIACYRGIRRGGLRALFADVETFQALAMLTVSLGFIAPFIIAFSSFRNVMPVYYFVVAYLAMFALRSPVFEGKWALRVRKLVGEPVVEKLPAASSSARV